jgi:hypothetical protein
MRKLWTFKIPTSDGRTAKPRTPDPTAEEIRRLTAEIQSGWSSRERLKRETGERRVEWSVPRVGVCLSSKSVE